MRTQTHDWADEAAEHLMNFALDGLQENIALTLRDIRAQFEAGCVVLQPAAQPSVIAEITAERKRQMEVEGWTFEHDNEHDTGEMAVAASCYALNATKPQIERNKHTAVPAKWPWDNRWWKPRSRRRDLVRAAALIVAEIERLDRRAALAAYDTPAKPDVQESGS